MPRLTRGFSLIEVLVTIFVVAIGLLAGAALQLMSKKTSYDAVQRTTAALLARDIAERMRANPTALSSYLNGGVTGMSQPASDCSSADCSPEQLAAADLWAWREALLGSAETADGQATGGLVSPEGCISAGAACGHYDIAIAWRGVTPLPEPDAGTPPGDPSLNACGASSGNYDDPRHPGADYRMRRILVVSTYIANPLAPCP